jgi:hypothetical protein
LDLRRGDGQDAPNQRIEPLKLRRCRFGFHATIIAHESESPPPCLCNQMLAIPALLDGNRPRHLKPIGL